MNPSPDLSAAPGHQIALLQMSCGLLQQELDVPFSIWVDRGDRFVPSVADAENPDPQEKELGTLVASVVQQDESSCLKIAEDRCLVVAAATTGAKATAAVVGIVETTDRTLLKRLVQCVLKQAEQERELQDVQAHLNEFADQVTNDFEELRYLRSLTEHIEVCDLRNDLATVSAAILPPLRELIDAEAVVLFTPSSPESVDPCPVSEDAAFVAGELPVSIDICKQIIEQSRHTMRDQPLVRNGAAVTVSKSGTGKLRNFILVRIARGGKHYGWLLVTNRRIVDAGSSSEPINASCLQEWEFGTLEAGLLNAASIMLGSHARNAELFSDKEHLLLGVMRALINAIDAKDAYTCGHSDRVALFASKIASAMKLDAVECQRVYMAGLLHDIGKIGVPDGVLCKAGSLTEEEFEQIKAHPEIGYSILKHVKQLEYVLGGVLHHHEAFDGSGYPYRLQGDDISLHGRILAVADAYDAMTSTRSYRKAMPTAKAEGIICEGSGTQWDPVVVDAFLSVIGDIRTVSQNRTAEKLTGDTGTSQGSLDAGALEAIFHAVNTMADM